MRTISSEELKEILEKHLHKLEDDPGGFMADLSYTDLQWTDLSYADLQWANLQGTNLQETNLQGTNLQDADLRSADLREANLQGANLDKANLQGANLDFSCWPLICGSFNVKADDRLVAQLVCHLTRLDTSQCSGGVQEAMKAIRDMAITNLFCEYRDDVKEI